MSTLEDYEKATFALVEMGGSKTPAMRRTVNSHRPWAIFVENQLIRFTDAEMMRREAKILGGGPQEDVVTLRKNYEDQLEHNKEIQAVIRQRNEQIRNLEKKVKLLTGLLETHSSKLFKVSAGTKSYPKFVVTELTGTVGDDGEALLPAPHTFYTNGAMAEVAFFNEDKGTVFRDRVVFNRGVSQAICGLPAGKLVAQVVGIGTEGYVTFGGVEYDSW